MKKERKAATQLPVPDFFLKSWEDSKRKGTDKLADKGIQADANLVATRFLGISRIIEASES